MLYGDISARLDGGGGTEPTVHDSFEDGDISEYSGTTGPFGVVEPLAAADGEYVLSGDNGSATSSSDEVMTRTDVTVSRGDDLRCAYAINNTTGYGELLFFVEAGTDESDVSGYSAYADDSLVGLARWDGGSWNDLGDTSISVSESTWYTLIVDAPDDGSDDITATVEETDGTTVGSFTATDNTYTSGGIGFNTYNGWPLFDYVRSDDGSVTVHDSFEDGDISEYSGTTGPYAAVVNGPPDGTHALSTSAGGSITDGTDEVMTRTDVTVSRGDDLRCEFMLQDTRGNALLAFVESGTDESDVSGYEIFPDFDSIGIGKWDAGSWSDLGGTDYNNSEELARGQWYTLIIDAPDDGSDDITATVETLDGTTMGSHTSNDGAYTSGGIGFNAYYDDTVLFDYVRAEN